MTKIITKCADFDDAIFGYTWCAQLRYFLEMLKVYELGCFSLWSELMCVKQ